LGTVFKISLAGKFTVLHSFNGTDGGAPLGGLVQDQYGNFYGTTSSGGSDGQGTIFKMSTSGSLTTLHGFSGTDGSTPYGSLVLTSFHYPSPATLYGTTGFGGTSDGGVIFEITSAGTYSTLIDLCSGSGCPMNFLAGLTLTADGSYFGTTAYGGTENNGTIVTSTDGLHTLEVAHNFCGGCNDGIFPQAPLFQHTNGILYGSASGGGADGDGTLYSMAEGKPFVAFVRNTGKVGQTAQILGQKLTGATQVLFSDWNGGTVAATFSVKSSTYMTATVPQNSKVGPVTVQTPSGKLTSSRQFLVQPQITNLIPTSGPVGSTVQVVGDSLFLTRLVLVGGVKASVAISDQLVVVTVPAGAKTGKITIVTDGGIAVSSQTFTVTQ
jgi:uncharacterized repeat protein (TIGR03803 family)